MLFKPYLSEWIVSRALSGWGLSVAAVIAAIVVWRIG